MRRNNSLIVLEALCMGLEVEHEGRIYLFRDSYNGGKLLTYKADSFDTITKKTSKVTLIRDIFLVGFIRMCSKMSKEKIFSIATTIALNRINGGKKK